MVSVCGLTSDLGYIRCRRTTRESGSETGAKRTVVRQVRVDRQLDADLGELLGTVALEFRDRLADQADVEVEADVGDVPGLLPAQQVAGTADLEVLHRDRHAAAEVGVLGQGGEPLVGGLGEGLLARVEEVGVRALARAPHTTSQLVQLGEAEGVGALDDHRVGVGHVETGLHQRRAHEHVEALLPEVDHDLLELLLVHLPVRGGDPGLGHQLADACGRLLDRLHPVVDVEDLALAQQLAAYGGDDLSVLVGADVGEHRVPLLGRRGDRRHLPDAGDRHLQGARDRRGRHRQHVDGGAHPLELLLVLDAEALLLVDDDQPEVLEADVGVEQPVGADDDVDAALGHAPHDLGRLLVGLEAAEPLETALNAARTAISVLP